MAEKRFGHLLNIMQALKVLSVMGASNMFTYSELRFKDRDCGSVHISLDSESRLSFQFSSFLLCKIDNCFVPRGCPG